MEFANIEELLKKYINAETTLKEEAYLKAYFSSEDIAPHLAEYQIMFTYFKTSKKDRFTKNIKNILNPYITTKEKGTGLGLAIVNKIINDHSGVLNFTSLDDGAKIEIKFKR